MTTILLQTQLLHLRINLPENSTELLYFKTFLFRHKMQSLRKF